jgi:hypothetical protein
MKLGAERKKQMVLVGLVLVAVIVYWFNSSSDSPSPSASARTPVDPSAAAVSQSAPTKVIKRRVAQGHTVLSPFQPELVFGVDPSKVDPTLRLDLLAKVQSIQQEGGERRIFQRELAPPQPVLTAAGGKIPQPDPIHPNGPPKEQASTPPPPPPPPGPPPTPPINLKYYGYSTKRSDGEKKAFFLDGEEIIVAAEGEIIKKQYKIVRIGVTSVQMEDTASKSTQTLPIQQDAAPV